MKDIIFRADNKIFTVDNKIMGRSLSFDMDLWLRADVGIVKDEDNKVSEWNDSSGNKNHVLQNTEINQPLWVGSGFNGKPVLRFNGSTTFLNGGNIINLGGQSHTFFTVGKATSDDGTFYSKTSSANVGSRYALIRGNGIIQSFYRDITLRNVSASQPLDKTSLYRIVINRENNSHTLAIDGDIVGSTDISGSMSSLFPFYVGASHTNDVDPPNTYLNGDIAEIIIFSQLLPSGYIQSLENYLMNKYAIS